MLAVLIIILAGLGLTGYLFGRYQLGSHLNQDDAILIAFIAGLLGALVPTVIKPYFDHRKAIYDRRLRHVNALSLLELRLHDISSALSANIQTFTSIGESIDSSKVTSVRPTTLLLEDSFFNDLAVGELINKLFSLRYDVHRLNRDIESFVTMYDKLSDAVILGNITPSTYKNQADGLALELPLLIQHMATLKDDSVNLLSYVQAREEQDLSGLMRWRLQTIQKKYRQIPAQTIEDLKQRHLKEVEENSQASDEHRQPMKEQAVKPENQN